jgi:hypothetical protein
MTQAEVARVAGVGRWKIVDLERNRLMQLSVDVLDRCFAVFQARVNLTVSYRRAELDRVLDERHAQLVAAICRLLRALGWEVKVEVTFNEYGDRGSIDVVAWNTSARALVVIEVKSELASIEGTLRPFAVKCRLAPKVVRDQFGWQPAVIGWILVLPEDSASRRAVTRHAGVLNTSLRARSRELRAWLEHPVQNIGGVWFLSDVGPTDTRRNPSAIQRVRNPKHRRPESVPRSRAAGEPTRTGR